MSIGPSIPEIQHFQNLTFKNPRSRSNYHDVAQLQVMTIPWNSKWYKSIQWFQRYGFRKVWPKCCLIWQVFGPGARPYEANGQITMALHNYRSRQVHETLNGVNPSSSFRDMRSAKSGPNLWQIWQVCGLWASPYRANGHMTMTVHTYRPRQFHRTSNGENPSSGYRDMGSASSAAARPAARPPARTVTTIPLQPGGLRGNDILMKLSTMTAPKVVLLTTFSAANDENFVKMTIFLFLCIWMEPTLARFNAFSLSRNCYDGNSSILWTRWVLVTCIANIRVNWDDWHQASNKPLPGPMMTYHLDIQEYFAIKLYLKFKTFSFKKMHQKMLSAT